MNIDYFLGIDFGHGETCVSRVPGYDNEEISRILLRRSHFVRDQKVMSAIYQKEGQWNLVFGKEDFKQENLREGFKGPIGRLKKDEPESLDALKEFGKLIFSTILKNDTDLKYDESTGEANFVICIANPSEWRRDKNNLGIPEEYLNFFREECGIKPAILCINESDAAFYTKFSKQNSKYSPNDTVFVIDLGSSTIDFTTYNNSKCITDGCWGHNLGAHIIEDKILSEGLAQNREKLQKAEKLRKQKGLFGNINAALSLYARKAKEDFYTNHDSTFELYLRMTDLVPSLKGTEAIETAFYISLEKEEFDNVISEYRNQLELALRNAAEQLRNKVMVSPQYIVLSGGASRMDFVEEYTRKFFPNATIDLDPTPEWVVSNGAAKYIQAQQSALEKLRDSIRAIDYKSIYKDADITATQEATKVLLPSVINKVTGSSNLTGWEMLYEFCKFFFELNSTNQRYVDLFNEAAKALLKEKISKSIKDVIFNEFKVDVDMSNISLQYKFAVMDWNPNSWSIVEKDDEIHYGQGCKIVMQAIEDSSSRINFTWDKIRTRPERIEIAEGCRERFSGRDIFGVQFDEQPLNDAADAIRQQTLDIAERLFHDKELFRTSNHK